MDSQPPLSRPPLGLSSLFGPLEAEVMEALWARGSGDVGEVAADLPRDGAYTTVKTILERLTKKGFLRRQREGKAYRYTPAVSRADLEGQLARHASQGLLRGLGGGALTHFVAAVRENPEQLRQLRALLSDLDEEERG